MDGTFDVTGRHVIVVGAGRSGLAAADLLLARGARVTVADSRPIDATDRLVDRGIAVAAGPHSEAMFRAADVIVLSPGVPVSQPAVQAARAAGVPVIGEVELASRWLAGRVVAITGTKGKSTTTTLAARMLREGGLPATAGGNLGVALSSLVEASTPDTIHVVEVSSFQLETVDDFHPWIAALLNMSPDHLDRHATFDEYRAAKEAVFRRQTSEDWAVINADDPIVRDMARAGRARRFDFALEAPIVDGVTVEGQYIVRCEAGARSPVMPIDAVRLTGPHLLADVLAATAVALIAGVAPVAIERAVRLFEGLEHALERVAESGGVTFVNDSKATNVAAARRAVESFPGGVVVILGGRYKGGHFEDLREALAAHAAGVVLIGEAADRIASAVAGVVPVVRAGTMYEAVREARALAPSGGVVLLAPACASFDMFEDYAARGRAFKDAVREVIAAAETGA